MLLVEKVLEIIGSKNAPDREIFASLFVTDNQRFIDQEDVVWDFKEEWPFSYSDEYFLAIARLIVAFHNTLGGLIIFGVHDKLRTGGHNKVAINLDKLVQTLSAYCGKVPQLQILHFDNIGGGSVDCLLIVPRSPGARPLKFEKQTKWGNTIFVREVSSVAKASPKHLPLLYCRYSGFEGGEIPWITGSLPPSPRKLERFIGRMKTMDELFNWLFQSDDPQMYIFGKGGSGKTSIAHEFASIVRRYGANIKIFGNDTLDLVMFLSAKERSFITGDNSKIILHSADFLDERTLYAQLIKFSGIHPNPEDLEDAPIETLKAQVTELFNEFSILLVLDDIDTITTKHLEVGTNFLYRTISRARRNSKLLCTQRDTPTHAIGASIEVPGLSLEGEFQEFVDACCAKYAVAPPNSQELDRLASKSERRPLVLEYIIALVRTCPSYDAAIKLFDGDTGADLRDYVFKREWSGLDPDARRLLAALALLDRPASFNDLATILQYGDGKLRDAIAAARAMFIQINSAGSKVTYGLDMLTRDFISQASKNIEYYSRIKARVQNLEKDFFPDVPQISHLRVRIQDALRKAYKFNDPQLVKDAWTIVSDPTISAHISEHPQFRSLYGYVCCKLAPPKLDDAREAFGAVLATKYEPPPEHMKAWFYAERDSKIGFANCIRVCDFVEAGRYEQSTKNEFNALKASTLFYRAREVSFDNSSDAASLYEQALRIHFKVYKENVDTANGMDADSERHIRNTCFTLLRLCLQNLGLERALASINWCLSSDAGYLDPIEEGITQAFQYIDIRSYDIVRINKSRRELARSLSHPFDPDRWLDKGCLHRLQAALRKLDEQLHSALKSAKR